MLCSVHASPSLKEQLASVDNKTCNETKPITKNKGGRPCNGVRPMTGYERLKAYRERKRGAETSH
jgi:hypothetical protein